MIRVRGIQGTERYEEKGGERGELRSGTEVETRMNPGVSTRTNETRPWSNVRSKMAAGAGTSFCVELG